MLEISTQTSFADRLRKALADSNMTQADLSRSTGIPKSTIHRIVTGKTSDPRLIDAAKIAYALDLPIGYLAGWR